MRAPCAVLILIALACRGHDSAESRGPAPADSSRLQVTAAPDSPAAGSLQPADVLGVLYEQLTAIGEGRAAVRSRLGEPLVTTTAAEANAHDAAATDTLIQWSFDHLHQVPGGCGNRSPRRDACCPKLSCCGVTNWSFQYGRSGGIDSRCAQLDRCPRGHHGMGIQHPRT